MTIRLGTRGSALALAQTELAANALRLRGFDVQIVIVHTRGDADVSSPLSEIGRGAFTDVFSEMISRGEIDGAVHSAKDLPTDEGRDGFFCLPRADARDALISRIGADIAAVGTGSPRRAAAVLARFPDAQVLPVRGNVDTRLKKLRTGEFDALVLACAGLDRLHICTDGLQVERLSPETCVPAACQGIIAVEGECGALIQDETAAQAAGIERRLQRLLGGGCTGGVGAYFDGTRLYAQKEGKICSMTYAGEESIFALAKELS